MAQPDFTGARWIKSRRSNEGGTNCVELATVDNWTGIRDSKLGNTSPVLTFTPTAMKAFFAQTKKN
jgi:hypothetical protein